MQQKHLHSNQNNSKKIIVTLGGTKEKIDSVRYITNSSSGKMGSAIADWAYYLGYDVIAISTIELKSPVFVPNLNSSAFVIYVNAIFPFSKNCVLQRIYD